MISHGIEYDVLKGIKGNPLIYGVWKTQEVTIQMANMFYSLLSRDAIDFIPNMAIHNTANKHDQTKLVLELIQQLHNYRRIPYSPHGISNINNDMRYRLSGKRFGKDDMLITVLMCWFWLQAYKNLY